MLPRPKDAYSWESLFLAITTDCQGEAIESTEQASSPRTHITNDL